MVFRSLFRSHWYRLLSCHTINTALYRQRNHLNLLGSFLTNQPNHLWLQVKSNPTNGVCLRSALLLSSTPVTHVDTAAGCGSDTLPPSLPCFWKLLEAWMNIGASSFQGLTGRHWIVFWSTFVNPSDRNSHEYFLWVLLLVFTDSFWFSGDMIVEGHFSLKAFLCHWILLHLNSFINSNEVFRQLRFDKIGQINEAQQII